MCVHPADSAEKSSCQYNLHRDTNFELKSSAFIPIAGILELVNRTLVDGISLLTWRRKRRKWKEKKKWRETVLNRTDTSSKVDGEKDRRKSLPVTRYCFLFITDTRPAAQWRVTGSIRAGSGHTQQNTKRFEELRHVSDINITVVPSKAKNEVKAWDWLWGLFCLDVVCHPQKTNATLLSLASVASSKGRHSFSVSHSRLRRWIFLSLVGQRSSSVSALLPFMVVQLYHVDSERQHCQLRGRVLP